jgi:hypothetical protein
MSRAAEALCPGCGRASCPNKRLECDWEPSADWWTEEDVRTAAAAAFGETKRGGLLEGGITAALAARAPSIESDRRRVMAEILRLTAYEMAKSPHKTVTLASVLETLYEAADRIEAE